MPSLDIFCLRIFIAFSRLSRTSTSTGFPNEFSIGSEVVTRSKGRGQAAIRRGARDPRRVHRHHLSALRLAVLVEQGDGQAVKLRVRALGDDLVDDLVVRVAADPISKERTEQFPLFGLRCRKPLHTSNIDHPAFAPRST